MPVGDNTIGAFNIGFIGIYIDSLTNQDGVSSQGIPVHEISGGAFRYHRVFPIIVAKCMNCHRGDNPSGGVNLKYKKEMDMVNSLYASGDLKIVSKGQRVFASLTKSSIYTSLVGNIHNIEGGMPQERV